MSDRFVILATIDFPSGERDEAVIANERPDGTATFFPTREAAVADAEETFKRLGLKALLPSMKMYTVALNEVEEFTPDLTGPATENKESDLW